MSTPSSELGAISKAPEISLYRGRRSLEEAFAHSERKARGKTRGGVFRGGAGGSVVVGGAGVNLLPSRADRRAFDRSQRRVVPGRGFGFGVPLPPGPTRVERRASRRADKSATRARTTPGSGFRSGRSTGSLAMGGSFPVAAAAPPSYVNPRPGPGAPSIFAGAGKGATNDHGPLRSPGRLKGVATGTYGRRGLVGGGVLLAAGGGAALLGRRRKKVEKMYYLSKSDPHGHGFDEKRWKAHHVNPAPLSHTHEMRPPAENAAPKAARKLGRKGKIGLAAGGLLIPAAVAGETFRRKQINKSDLALLGDLSKSAMPPFLVSKGWRSTAGKKAAAGAMAATLLAGGGAGAVKAGHGAWNAAASATKAQQKNARLSLYNMENARRAQHGQPPQFFSFENQERILHPVHKKLIVRNVIGGDMRFGTPTHAVTRPRPRNWMEQ